MRTAAEYIALAKVRLGNEKMSDRELAERLGGFSQSYINRAKTGKMTDPVAMRLAEILTDVEPGEILMVARLEREKDDQVRAALTSWASKTLAAMSMVAAASSASAAGCDVAAVRAETPRVCIMSTDVPQTKAASACVHDSCPTRSTPSDWMFSVNTDLARGNSVLLGP